MPKLKFIPTDAIQSYYVNLTDGTRAEMGKRQNNNVRLEKSGLKPIKGIPDYDVANVEPKQAAHLLKTFPKNFEETNAAVNITDIIEEVSPEQKPKPDKQPNLNPSGNGNGGGPDGNDGNDDKGNNET